MSHISHTHTHIGTHMLSLIHIDTHSFTLVHIPHPPRNTPSPTLMHSPIHLLTLILTHMFTHCLTVTITHIHTLTLPPFYFHALTLTHMFSHTGTAHTCLPPSPAQGFFLTDEWGEEGGVHISALQTSPGKP